jgi:hypothetical protein
VLSGIPVRFRTAWVAYLHAATSNDRVINSELSTIAAMWVEIARRVAGEASQSSYARANRTANSQ